MKLQLFVILAVLWPACCLWEEVAMVKPIQDTREYSTSTLSNGLEVLLITDKDSVTAHAGLAVGVGSFQDPEHLAGLAHFLEHMLFMGSSKYPQMSAFSDCVSAHQGSSNAQTESEFTSYFMDVAEDGLLECLDIFAQFFVSPLLDKHFVDKEVNAVDSEYQNSLASQSSAKYAAFKLMTDIQHPLHRFTCGNIETLWNNPRANQVDVVDSLRHFHSQFYSSNIMKLVLITSQSPETLQPRLQEIFGKVPNKNVDRGNLYKKQDIFKGKNQMVRLKAKEKQKQLTLVFELDWPRADFAKKSVEVVTEHLGHNGPESLQRFLKDSNWVTELSTGFVEQSDEQCVLELELSLTEQGYFHRQTVLDNVFSYLKQLASQDWKSQEYVWKQLKKTNEQMFRMGEKAENTVSLAQDMFHYPLDQLLYHPYNYSAFDTLQVTHVLSQMNRSKVQLIVSNDEFNFDRLMKLRGNDSHKYFDDIYQIHYQKQDMNLPIQESLPVHFNVSDKMLQYIPSEEIHEYLEVPEVAYEKEGAKLWHIHLQQLKLEQHSVSLMVYSSESFKTALDASKSALFEKYLHQLIDDRFFNVNGLYTLEVSTGLEGLFLQFSGHSQHLDQIVLDFFQQLHNNYTLSPDKFQTLQADFLQEQENVLKQDCYEQAQSRVKSLLFKYYYDPQVVLDEARSVTLDSLMAYKTRFLQHTYLEAFVAGQVRKEAAVALVRQVESLLDSQDPVQTKTAFGLIDQRMSQILEQNLTVSQVNRNPSDNNECFVQYTQLEKESTRTATIWGLMGTFLEESSFEFLRSEHQLGYVVVAQPSASLGVQGVTVVVQGSRKGTAEMALRVDQWWTLLQTQVANMTQDKFSGLKHSFQQVLMQKETDLATLTSRFWNHIQNRDYLFNKRFYVMQLLDTLSQKDILAALSRKDKGTLHVNVRVANHEDKFQKEGKDSDTHGIKDSQWPVYKQFLDQNSAGFRFLQRLVKNRKRSRVD